MLGTISTAYNVSSYGIAPGGDELAASVYAYWQFNGAATDAAGNVDLTAVNSPTYDTGLVFAQAASLAAASTQYFTNTSVAISPVTVASSELFTVHAWIYWSTFAAQEVIFRGGTANTAANHWGLFQKLNTTNRIQGSISNGTTAVTVTSTGTPTLDQWTSVFFWHAGDGKAQIQLDADTPDVSTGTMTGSLAEKDDVYVGGVSSAPMNALLGPMVYWAGRALSASERADYYNSGAGRVISL